MQYDDGSVYTGQWKEGQYWGRGRLTTKDEEYDGDWAGKKQGQGKWVSKTNGSYEGWWDNDKKSGRGTLTFNNSAVLKGTWVNDKPNGDCRITWPQGIRYRGHVSDEGLPDGQGRKDWPDGSYYEGKWKNSRCHGHGFHWSKDKNRSYDGNWKMGDREGNFTVTFKDGTKKHWKYSKNKRIE